MRIALALGLFLFCVMVLGMIANYYWDLIRAGKSLADEQMSEIILPPLVSPIVFYAIWSLVKTRGGEVEIDIAWPFVAFQNGFF